MSHLPTKPVAEPWSEVVRLTQAVRELERDLAEQQGETKRVRDTYRKHNDLLKEELTRQEPVMEAASALYNSTDWDLKSPKEARDVYGAYRDYLAAKA